MSTVVVPAGSSYVAYTDTVAVSVNKVPSASDRSDDSIEMTWSPPKGSGFSTQVNGACGKSEVTVTTFYDQHSSSTSVVNVKRYWGLKSLYTVGTLGSSERGAVELAIVGRANM